tara:strand:+ start:16 stop:432 length:417 start_codon:yes stop_codon:yes gene_type:complete
MGYVEQAIRSRLTSQSSVTDLVSTRIYPLAAPQGASLPYVIYDVGTDPVESMSGHAGLTFAGFSISCYATTYASVKAISEQIRLVLDGWSGTSEGVSIKSVIHGNSNDIYGTPKDGSSLGIFQVNSAYKVGFVSTIPS